MVAVAVDDNVVVVAAVDDDNYVEQGDDCL